MRWLQGRPERLCLQTRAIRLWCPAGSFPAVMLEDDGMDDALLGFDIDAAMDSRQQQQQKAQTQQQQQPWQSPSAGLPAAAPAAVVMMTAMQVTAPTFVAIPAAKTAQQQEWRISTFQFI